MPSFRGKRNPPDMSGEEVGMGLLDGRRFIVRFGQGGHEHEHCVNIEGYRGVFEDAPNIPSTVSERLSVLIRHAVSNRGSRIEILVPEDHHKLIVASLKLMGGVEDPKGLFLWDVEDRWLKKQG